VTDTHWRPDTMQRVAEALAGFVREHATLPQVTAPGYAVERREAQQLGDTAAMLDLPPEQTLYPRERVTLAFVVDAAGDPWRSARDADILVLGDSFTNIYSLPTMGWGEAAGLVEHLSYTLQRPVDRIVQNDDGAHATREALRREVGGGADRLAGKRVVIWQFAARELASGDWKMIGMPRSAQ
jgi:alginate O-acetyltransferase complex protein AlgJ